MTTVGKVVLGMMGRLRPQPAIGNATPVIELPPAVRQGGMPLMAALDARRSTRSFKPDPLPLAVLSNLLWAAYGVNRADGGRTAPSAINAQEIDIYVAMASGAFRYEAAPHRLQLARVTTRGDGNEDQ